MESDSSVVCPFVCFFMGGTSAEMQLLDVYVACMAKIRRDRLYVRDYGQVESGKAMLLTFV